MDIFVEVEHAWLFALGVVLLLGTAVDVVWTVIAAALGRGPFSMLITGGAWRILTLGRPSRRRRQIAGYLLVVTLLLVWVLLLLTGFALLYFSGDRPIVDANNPGRVTPLAVVAYAAGGLAGAGAGFTASSGFWELVNNLSAVIGLAFFTLGVTFLLRVVSADARARATASQISGLGRTPRQVVDRALGEPNLGSLNFQIVTASSGLSQVAQDHLALPVLRYLQPVDEQASTQRSVVLFDEVLTLLEAALTEQRPLLVASGRSAVDDYMSTLKLGQAETATPPTVSLEPLQAQPHSIVSEEQFAKRLYQLHDRRAELQAVLTQAGWTWRDVYGVEGADV